MKILIDGRLYGLENAGLGRYTINLINELLRIDHQDSYILLLRKKYFNRLNLPENWEKVLADFRHYSLIEQIAIPSVIQRKKPDISHFLHFNVPLAGVGKYIVTIHDLLMHKQKGLEATTLPAPIYFLKRLGYKTIFRNAILNAAKVIVPSEAIKKEITSYYKLSSSKVKVIYEGVDEKISFGQKNSIPMPYFIYVGNAYPHKNLRRLIEATILLNKNLEQKVLLAIASSRNVFTQKLQRTIDKLNAGQFVKLLGFIPDSKLGTLYQNAKAFVFPSTREGFGLPGLEAMASGTLVLASDIPVFREVYQDAAIYFNPLDFSSIEKAMKDVLGMNRQKRQEMISFGQKFAKRYSWSKMAKQTLEVYNETVGSVV